MALAATGPTPGRSTPCGVTSTARPLGDTSTGPRPNSRSRCRRAAVPSSASRRGGRPLLRRRPARRPARRRPGRRATHPRRSLGRLAAARGRGPAGMLPVAVVGHPEGDEVAAIRVPPRRRGFSRAALWTRRDRHRGGGGRAESASDTSPRLMSSHLATRRERAPPTEGRSSRQEAPRHRRTRRPRPARVRRRHRTPARGRPLRQARSARRGCRHPGRPRQRRRDYRTRRFGGALRPRPTMSSGLNPSTPSSAPCATTCALSPARTSSRPAASSPRTTCCPWASSRSGHAPGNRPPQLEARDAFRKVSSSVAWCAWRAAAGRG